MDCSQEQLELGLAIRTSYSLLLLLFGHQIMVGASPHPRPRPTRAPSRGGSQGPCFRWPRLVSWVVWSERGRGEDGRGGAVEGEEEAGRWRRRPRAAAA
uniref:Uncharacterized protein n=1 Tax=Arundo donax TaxID=35708 RepID=A0A0A9DMV7_ARUDO